MNERLRAAMTRRVLDPDALAEAIKVDPKTVERWIGGRTPRARHRWSVASLLGEDEAYLWPNLRGPEHASQLAKSELVAFYPSRATVPPDLWLDLLRESSSHVDILVYAANFLHEQYPSWNDQLKKRADEGCSVRVAVGDPNSEAVRLRGLEEQFGEGIESRCRAALRHYDGVRGVSNIAVRLHGTTLYNSIYRFDDQLLVNTHIYGINAYAAPTIHVRRLSGGTLFDSYRYGFEAVWESAVEAPAPEGVR